MLKLLVNPAQRKLALSLLLIFLLTAGLLMFQAQQAASQTMQSRTDQIMGLLGFLSETGYLTRPAGSDESPAHQQLAAALEGQTTPAQLAAGRAWLADYSLDDLDTVSLAPDYTPMLTSLLRYLMPVSLLALLLLSLIAMLLLHQVHRQIRAAATQAAQYASRPEQLLENRLPVTSEWKNHQEGDLAALQQALRQLAEKTGGLLRSLKADKLYLKDFLSDISHQIKTPLAVLRLDHELMLGQPGMPAEQREKFLHQDIRQLDRIEWLIQGLLKMARLEAGVVRMNLQLARLADTVRQAALPLGETMAGKSVCLEIDVPPDISIDHDPDWVAEALSNLLKNALEHTPAGGVVRVTALRTPMTIQLKVSDTGPGLAADEIPRIFERFYNKGSQPNKDSVGIGLSLARTIFEQNGATLTAASQPGQGATFTATFLNRKASL